jgi:hypothetical protein
MQPLWRRPPPPRRRRLERRGPTRPVCPSRTSPRSWTCPTSPSRVSCPTTAPDGFEGRRLDASPLQKTAAQTSISERHRCSRCRRGFAVACSGRLTGCGRRLTCGGGSLAGSSPWTRKRAYARSAACDPASGCSARRVDAISRRSTGCLPVRDGRARGLGSGGRVQQECTRWSTAAPTRPPPSLRLCARPVTLVPSGRPCRSARPFGGGLGPLVGAAPGRPGGLREAASLRAGAGVDGGGPLSPPPQRAAGLGHARLSPLPPHRRTRCDRHAGDRTAGRRAGHDAQDPRRRRHRPISGLAARIHAREAIRPSNRFMHWSINLVSSTLPPTAHRRPSGLCNECRLPLAANPTARPTQRVRVSASRPITRLDVLRPGGSCEATALAARCSVPLDARKERRAVSPGPEAVFALACSKCRRGGWVIGGPPVTVALSARQSDLFELSALGSVRDRSLEGASGDCDDAASCDACLKPVGVGDLDRLHVQT